MKLCWLDVRAANGTRIPIVEEAVHQTVDAIVASDISDLAGLPPTVKKVLIPVGAELPEQDLATADIVMVDTALHGGTSELAVPLPGRRVRTDRGDHRR